LTLKKKKKLGFWQFLTFKWQFSGGSGLIPAENMGILSCKYVALFFGIDLVFFTY